MGVILRIMEEKMETTTVCWGYIGIMEEKMETTTVCWGYIGIMEEKMETTTVYASSLNSDTERTIR